MRFALQNDLEDNKSDLSTYSFRFSTCIIKVMAFYWQNAECFSQRRFVFACVCVIWSQMQNVNEAVLPDLTAWTWPVFVLWCVLTSTTYSWLLGFLSQSTFCHRWNVAESAGQFCGPCGPSGFQRKLSGLRGWRCCVDSLCFCFAFSSFTGKSRQHSSSI